MVAPAQSSLSLFPSPDSSKPPPATRPGAAPSPPGAPEPRGAQPVLRIRTTVDDDAVAGRAAFRPIEFQPPRREPARDGEAAAAMAADNADAPHAAPEPQRTTAPRSMFPVYDPGLPLDQQHYGPTQASPACVPRAVISRRSYREEPPAAVALHGADTREPPRQSTWPRDRESAAGPRRPCSTSQLRGLWKAANGWKACRSEGRVYCLALSRRSDAPVYTLASGEGQPFYNLRLDPKSASAYVALARHDPGKPYKPPKADAVSASPAGSQGGGGSRSSDTKGWHEALTTTLQESGGGGGRARPPDGLVALLMPSPAAKMAQQRAGDPAAVSAADNECARLVWDDDAATHFLVHPALATPFRVAVEAFPAYSRIEYTLEHHESPRHLAKLTRDGAGGGSLEVDTAVTSMIESYYIVDVAVAALLLVACADDRHAPAAREAFAPPPLPPRAVLAGGAKRSSSRFRIPGLRRGNRDGPRMEEFGIDVESQDGSLGKGRGARRRESQRPLVLRATIKIAKGLFKGAMCLATVLFKCVAGVFKLLYKCVGSKY